MGRRCDENPLEKYLQSGGRRRNNWRLHIDPRWSYHEDGWDGAFAADLDADLEYDDFDPGLNDDDQFDSDDLDDDDLVDDSEGE